MRVYKQNDKGEKLYYLECINFRCKYNATSIIKTVWSKDEPKEFCDTCGGVMCETYDTYMAMPFIDNSK